MAAKRAPAPWRRPAYNQLGDDGDGDDNLQNGNEDYDGLDDPLSDEPALSADKLPPFSAVDYAIFLFMGIAMLWAWNMFLAAAPYFQRRFQTSKALLANFQATEVSVSTATSFFTTLALARLQANASYPRRVIVSLVTLETAFALLAVSTKLFTVGAGGYFAFFVVMVLISSAATAFLQNGTIALASKTGRPEYVQGIMTGQAIAGVLPPLVQIISVLSTGEAGEEEAADTSTAALIYFLAATGVLAIALLLFGILLRRQQDTLSEEFGSRSAHAALLTNEDASSSNSSAALDEAPTSVPLTLLARKLFFPGLAVFFTFGITMVFPVFTQATLSTNPAASPLLHRAAYIPLAFLVWNVGDLLGRLLPLVRRLALDGRPKILLALALARIVFVPLYMICNVTSPEEVHTAAWGVTMPDAFYLLAVQLPFGLTNGYLGSCTMMGTPALVEPSEREAAGGFMVLLLVAGLAVGSLCSFFVGNAV